MRLTDADELVARVMQIRNTDAGNGILAGWCLDTILRFVDEAPTVDPIKHGHWINKGFEPTRCSVCGITVDAINGIPWAIKSFKYCPYCGAKMGEVEEHLTMPKADGSTIPKEYMDEVTNET